MNLDPKQLSAMSPREKRALVEQLLRNKIKSGHSQYELSYNQRALWFLHELSPQSATYNFGEAVVIKGNLNIEALHRAIDKLADRHSILRTTINSKDGVPFHRVHEHIKIPFHEEDVSPWTEEELREHLTLEMEKPFNLETEPLARVGVYKRSSKENILLLTMHHLIGEFWSLVILVNELGKLYEAETTGTAVNLRTAPFYYVDFVNWQSEMLASEEGERQWQYWKSQLEGDIPLLEFPVDRRRQSTQSHRGDRHFFTIGQELTQKLKALSKRQGV